MDNKYWKDWDTRSPRKEDSTNNPYYNQPTHSPYKGQSFAIASMIFGMLSFVLNCVVGLPFICAGFSFIFAALAHRKGKRRNPFVFYGISSACFGIGSGIFTLLQTWSQLQIMLQETLSQLP